MCTLNDLIRKEELAHATGLRGDALEARFQSERTAETKPLYRHSVSRQLHFFERMYKLTFENEKNPPDFNEWLGPDCYDFVYN